MPDMPNSATPLESVLTKLIKRLHAAKGRYHNQIAICDLFDAVGLPNKRPGDESLMIEKPADPCPGCKPGATCRTPSWWRR
jgi:hypothetical protein